MRNFLLLITLLLAIISVDAQVVVLVNSPSNIAGPRHFSGTAADFGSPDLSTGLWTADAVFVDNGSATPTIGCGQVNNGAEITGKIALIDRGTCSFSEKVSLAEDAGAIAVVVFNHTAGAGTFAMGTTAGFPVTIPAVMLSYEDGQIIRGELANGPVNMTIGFVQFDNSVRIDAQKVMNAPYGTVPIFETGDGKFVVTPGASVLNFSVNDATNTLVEATIEHEGNTVYTESDIVAEIISGDTSELLLLPSYEPTELGQYNISYNISFDEVDQYDFDNTASNTFYVSNNVFSKANWDETNNRPNVTTGFTRAGGGNVMFMSGFKMHNANGGTLDSVKFYVSTSLDSFALLADESEVRVYAFLWEDLNEDSTFTSDEFTTVAFNTVELNPGVDEQWITIELLDAQTFDGPYTITEDEVNIIVAPRFEGAETVFFGFDESIDQTQRVENLLLESDLDLPYLQTNAWDADSGVPGTFGLFNNGMGGTTLGATATALYVTPGEPNNTQEPLLEDITVNIYPNPATDRFTTEVELPSVSKFIEYTVRDAAGRQLFAARKDNVQMDKAVFNTSALPTGQYYLMVRTENGVATYPVSVQR